MFRTNRENKFKLTVVNDLISKMEDTDLSEYTLIEGIKHHDTLIGLIKDRNALESAIQTNRRIYLHNFLVIGVPAVIGTVVGLKKAKKYEE